MCKQTICEILRVFSLLKRTFNGNDAEKLLFFMGNSNQDLRNYKTTFSFSCINTYLLAMIFSEKKMSRLYLVCLFAAVTILIIGQTDGCSWPGHCIGAPCNDYNDCSDDLICGVFCPTHGCGGGPKQCMRPYYGRRRRRDFMKPINN